MKFFSLFCLLCGWVSLAHALDREAFTFTKYELEVRVEPEQQRLGVRGKIALRNDSSSAQASLALQISSSLNWSSIEFDGKPVEFVSQTYTSDIDHTGALSEAIVVLPRPAASKQVIELEVGYEGVIPLDATRLTRIGVPEEVAKHSDWDQIGRTFTSVRGVGYVAWYPIAVEAASLTEGDSLLEAVDRWKRREAQAGIKITFIHSSSSVQRSTLFCNGGTSLLRSEQLGDAFSERTACAFDSAMTVPVFIIGNFQALDSPEVNVSYLPEHKSGAEDYAAAAEEVTPVVKKWFGDHREKSDSKAQIVDLADSDAAPFESGNVLLTPLSGSDTKLLLSEVKQLTHAAFPSPRPWIRDGLARYAQARFVEEREGRQAAIQYLQSHRNSLGEAKKAVEKDEVANSLTNSADELYVQTRAMNVWWMLRDMIGEDALTATLRNYKAADDHDAQYMQKLIEARTRRDLGWFFDDWVYHDRGFPDFRIASVYSSQLPSGGYMVTVTVENLGEAGAEVPVTLHMQTGEASERLVIPGKSKASVRIQTASLPADAVVNDGSVPESEVSHNVYKIESPAR